MDGYSHVINDILYENTGYLSLPFHNIEGKKRGASGDSHSQNKADENLTLPLNIILYKILC